MHVGTVVEHLQGDAGAELAGQVLVFEPAALYGLGRLAEHERERVLGLAYLPLQVGSLGKHRVVIGLGAADACRVVACAQLLEPLHHVPCLLGDARHLVHYLQLAVEHQQSVVHVGYVGNDLGLYHKLVILGGKQGRLGTALLREQVAEQVKAPARLHRKRVSLGRLAAVPRRERALRREGERRHKGQLGGRELCLDHLHVEGSVEQVDVVLQTLLYQRLQLRVGEHLAPRQVAEIGGVAHSQRVAYRRRVTHKASGVDVGALVFVVESAAAQEQRCGHYR